MQRTLFLLLAFVLGIVTAGPAFAQAPAQKTKILITPFEYQGAANSLYAFSLSVPAHIAERLEDDPALEPINGELVLTEAQAKLVNPKGKHYDLAQANRLARALGAKYFLTGRFSGQVWTWRTEAFVYEADTREPRLVGQATHIGSMWGPITFTDWKGEEREVETNSAINLFAFAGKVTAEAFAKAGVPLAPASVTAISQRPSGSQDAFASLLLGRAYFRYFNGGEDEIAALAAAAAKPAKGKAAAAKKKAVAKSPSAGIGWAEEAARNDPTHAEAKRFYGFLLLKRGSPRLARFQFEFAIAARANDVRSLVQLGRLEMQMTNPDLAAGYLKRATEARPKDGDPFYWYGIALLHLGKTPQGITALETARTLLPGHGPARKELALQYALGKRYPECAAEMESVARDIEPKTPEATFQQAACLRAGGLTKAALTALQSAAERFPQDARIRKFSGDLLAADGELEKAMEEYRTAFAMTPSDSRLRAMFDPTAQQLPLGGAALLAATTKALTDDARAERLRAESQAVVNAATADLADNGSKACVDGRAPSYALLAERLRGDHLAVAAGILKAAHGISEAFRSGESAAYAPDEALAAQRVIAQAKVSERDARELAGQYERSFLPMFERHGCGEYDGPLNPATVEQARAFNADRRVKMPPYKPPPASTTFMPQINPEMARLIRFSVNNQEGRLDKQVVLDGKALGTVSAGESKEFEVPVGDHRLCVIPESQTCGDPATIRLPFLHDGWSVTLHAGATDDD